MCLFRRRSIRDYDPKTRRIWALGQLALVAHIVPAYFASGFGQRHPAFTFGLRCFLLAVTLVCFGWSARRMHNANAQAR